MIKNRTILAVMLFAAFAQNFTTTPAKKEPSNLNNNKWSQSTWVNPFAQTKTITVPVSWELDAAEWYDTYYFHIWVDGVLTVNRTTDGSGTLNVPMTSTVLVSLAVAPNSPFELDIKNTATQETIYYTNTEKEIWTSFTAFVGNSYSIFANGH